MTSQSSVIGTASEWLNSAFTDPDGDVVLTSPYLSSTICARIANEAEASSQSWTLYTELDPSAVAGEFLSVAGLNLLLDAGVAVRHVERLHAKCFISGTSGMLGSGNLTGAGLNGSEKGNRELGVELSPDQVEEARAMIAGWPYRRVTKGDLDALAERAKKLPVPVRIAAEPVADSSLLDVERLLADARDPSRTLWVKVEYGVPVPDQWRTRWMFASPGSGRDGGAPRIKTGDLVFICARGTKDCYVVVEVTTDPERLPLDYVEWAADREGEDPGRWPWVTRTIPRLVPSKLVELKFEELRNGKKLSRGDRFRLDLAEFTVGVRALAQLPHD
ncbi:MULTISPECIES: hypothetical protein [Terrabacteria group]|uniref:hypothetical protein n=1 Tax=Bacillati TaxID=1783272 RepID=UPI003641F579